MRHVIIGTAGHVDHGKSTLIKSLTGIETDRLKEEKERGLSIELGFAYFDLPDGLKAGIVDVPGHEKFIRQMLSGAYGMDIVLLVVDAKEGLQEQTLEHLEIVDLLGISNGILVMTKSDLVSADQLAESTEMCQEMLIDTTLENVPTISVSAITRSGIDQLKNTITDLANQIVKKDITDGVSRLYVDRVFTMEGFGAVVTGTLIGGSVQRDQRLRSLPSGSEVRIRGVQVHGEKIDQARSGQRTALNLSNVTREIKRGDLLCPTAISETTTNIDVKLQVLKSFPRTLDHWTRLRFYVGTREVFCRSIMLIEEAIFPGDSAIIQIRLEEPIVAFRGDRFILRDFSAQHTVGGGEILNPFAPKHKRFADQTTDLLEKWSTADSASAVIGLILDQSHRVCVETDQLRYYVPSDRELKKTITEMEKSEDLIRWKGTPSLLSSADRVGKIETEILEILDHFHETNPLEIGQNFSQVRQKIGLDQDDFEIISDRLIKDNKIVKKGNTIRLSSHQISFSDHGEKIRDSIETILINSGFNSPSLTEIVSELDQFPKKAIEETFFAMIDLGKIVRIGGGTFLHAEIFDHVKKLLVDHLTKNVTITIAEFRELIGTSRKYAVPFLEFCDGQGITIRVGNERKLRKN